MDIGGASGSFLAMIMDRYDVVGAVCDQTQVELPLLIFGILGN